MTVDEEKADANRLVLQDVQRPEPTTCHEERSNKEVKPLKESIEPIPKRSEDYSSESTKPPSKHVATIGIVPRSKRRGLARDLDNYSRN